MINPNDSIDKLMESANLSTDQSLPATNQEQIAISEAPFAEQTTEPSVFTGEETKVAMGIGRSTLQKIKELKKVNLPNPTDVIVEAPLPAIVTAPKKVDKKQVNKLKSKIAQEAPANIDEFNLQVEKSKEEITLQTQKIEEAKISGDTAAIVSAEEQLKSPNKAINLLIASTDITDQAVLDAVSKSISFDKQSLSQANLILLAEDAGYDINFVNSISSKTLTATDENMAKAMVMQKDIKDSLKGLYVKVNNKTITATERLDAVKQMQLYTHLFKSVKGYKSDAASALSMAKAKVDDILSSKQLQETLNNTMPTDRLDEIARLMMDDAFPDSSFGEVLSNALDGEDGWSISKRLWQNGVLGGPGTLSRLSIGEIVKVGMLPIARTGAAAMYYPTYPFKKLVGMNAEDRYYFTEAFAMMKSYKQALTDGSKLFATSWKTGVPTDTGIGRAELQTNRNVDILDYNPETLFGKGKAALNLLMTYGSKLTLSGGEFFKGMNNRLESVAYATRKEIETLNDYLDSDQPIDEAIFASKNSYAEALNNPPKEIWAEAKKSVLEQEAGPITKKLEEFTQMPGAFGLSAKMLFSFARTTANDIYDLIEYTPANIFISGNVKENSAFTNVISGLKNRRLMEDLRSADPKKIDMAMSRMGIGSFIMYGFSQLSADGYITGSGPSDPKARTNLINQGWQPNSLKISKKWLFPFSDDSNEFNNAQITEIKKLPQTVMGKDESAGYVYISLGGLGRIGSLARIASNFTEYSKYEKQTEKLPAPAGAIIATVSDYMDDSTLVNGALKLLTGLHSVYREPESNKSVNLVKDTTSSTIEMLTKMIPTIGALNFGRQSYDINKRNTAADPNDPAFIQGLEEGLNKLYNQVPGLSNELPMRKNAWGEPVDIEYPLSFIRMSEGKAKPVDRLIQTSQARVGEPQKFLTETIEDEDMQKMSVNVQLNTEEYDELVRIANKDLNLEDRMASVLDSIDKMKSAFNVEDKTLSKKELDNANIELLRAIALELENINEQTYSEARELLYNDSKYSNTLQNRAKREAKNKRATYQLMPGAK